MARKKPFSHKQKKKQLQEKRQEKAAAAAGVPKEKTRRRRGGKGGAGKGGGGRKPRQGKAGDLVTVFAREADEAVQARREAARLPMVPVEAGAGPALQWLQFPRRPAWSYGSSAQAVEAREEAAFRRWLAGVYGRHGPDALNHFEHNLEVWRQLWRVCEASDVLLLLADVRAPLLHLPLPLVAHVTRELAKPLVLVLTKADLVPPAAVQAWQEYFAAALPGVAVVPFSSHPHRSAAAAAAAAAATGKRKRRRRNARDLDVSGGNALVEEACRLGIALKPSLREALSEAARAEFDRTAAKAGKGCDRDAHKGRTPSDEAQAREHSQERHGDDTEVLEEDEEEEEEEEEEVLEVDEEEEERRRAAGGGAAYLTVGTIGQPNVGKSSLVNGLRKRKVVSTSRTPGHTKHFQTIFVTPSIRLCDCPGLVFPALGMPRPLQVLAGVYPIAQVREPYSAVAYLGARVPVARIYALDPPDYGQESSEATATQEELAARRERHAWSGWDLCEAYAIKRGFTTRKGRPDPYRAGLMILRDVLDGVVLLNFLPPPTPTQALALPSMADEPEEEPQEVPSEEEADEETEEEEEEEEEDGGILC